MFKSKGLFVFGLLLACLLVGAVNARHIRPPRCFCPMIPIKPAPVCGSDGITYDNIQALNCANCGKSPDKKITVAHQGNCKKQPLCKCPMIPAKSDPVCGSDGITYRNIQALNCANCGKPQNKKITVVHKGNCRRGGH